MSGMDTVLGLDSGVCRCLLAVTLLAVHDAHCRCPQL